MGQPRACIGYGFKLPNNLSFDEIEEICNDSPLKCSIIYSGTESNKTSFILMVDESIQVFGLEGAEMLRGAINQPNPRPQSVRRLEAFCIKLNIPFNPCEVDWYCCIYNND